MKRHDRLEKCNICNELRLTRTPALTGTGPPEPERPAEPADGGTGSGRLIEHSSSEFGFE